MLRSHRSIILAVVGWLILCGAQPPQKQGNGSSATNESPNPNGTSFIPYSNYNSERCYKSDNHDAADLCAQWRAAIAAEKAAHEARRATTWSIIATLLGALGTGFIVWTFAEQRATSRRELRAYLFAENVAIYPLKEQMPETENGKVGSTLIVKNSGQTPAIAVTHFCALKIHRQDDEASLDLDKPERSGSLIIPPGGFIHAHRRMGEKLTADDIQGIRNGVLAIYVYGRIDYKDAFGHWRHTNYRLAYAAWPLLENLTMNIALSGNEAS